MRTSPVYGLLLLSLTTLAPWVAAEPLPRKATPVPFVLKVPFRHVSSAAELPDGRWVVTDANAPSVLIVDPATGVASQLGSPGAGPGQYVRPGGLYGGPDGSLLLLDRAQMRVMTISGDGTFGRSYSIAVRGTTTASDEDVDLQRIDARGFSYFAARSFGFETRPSSPAPATRPLVRFDAASQEREEIATLRLPERRTMTEGNVTRSRSVVGSPADGWGVTPDGRVAVVRGDPYRVDWIAPDGLVTSGPELPYDPIPITEADKQAYIASRGPMPSVRLSGSAAGVPAMEPLFAETKSAFSAGDVAVSPDAQVWVVRSEPAGSTVTTYDVFNDRGQRIDRLEFPGESRIVGFGRGCVFVREIDASGRERFRKYLRKQP